MPEYVKVKRRQLNEDCRKMIRSGSAPGTRANHKTHRTAYMKFCNEYYYKPFPATEWRYCQFAQHLANQNKVPETVVNYVGTVRVMHRLKELPCPQANQIHYKLLTEGLKKTCKEPVRQVHPMNHQTLSMLYDHVDFSVELEAVAWVAVLVGFTLVLRVSNIGPDARTNF